MIKKRTKAIRNFLALLVLLTTGGTQQVWAQTETLSDLDDAQIQLSYDGGITYNSSDGTVTGVAHENYKSYNWCLMVEIRVNPKAGYITKLSQMTSNWNGDTYTPFDKVREGDGDPYEGELVFVPYDPADDEASPLYGHYEAKRTILVYSKKRNPTNFAVNISFTYVGIFLQNKLGDNATVTFYEPNADFAPENETFVFDPVAYTGNGAEIIAKKPADFIDNSDGNDHYVIAHIVPNSGYWTDRTLLMAYEAGGALARTRAPIVDPAYTLKLLQADTYDDAESNTKSRHDGAGWYYYKMPKEHNYTNGYKYSIIDGFVVKHFYFSDDDPKATIAQDFDNNTVTVGRTTDDWTAVLTYDKFVWSFTGTIGTLPHVQSISIQKGGTELLNLTDATTIDILVNPEYTAGTPCIGYNDLKPSAGENGWFVGRDDRYSGQTLFIIEPPFQPVDPTQAKNTWGSSANPWAIASAADLNMLSKCLTIGAWNTEKQYLRQTDDIDMSEVNDFLPIGISNPGVPFKGHYDGNGKTISGIKVTYSTESDPHDPIPAYVGLFGLVEGTSDDPASVENVTLENSSFVATAGSCAVAVGGIAGSIQGSNPTDATISNCKVLVDGENAASAISGLSKDCATGAIVGNFLVGTLSNNYYGYGVTVSNSSGTASGYTKRGTWMGTVPLEGGTPTYAWDDFNPNDGAMLWVKKASIGTITKPTDSKAVVTFNEKTVGDNCYAVDGDNIYYAVGQKVTLLVTPDIRTSGIFTFQDELTALTMSDGTTNTDIKETFAFTMPESDVTVSATFKQSDWFTIKTNGKEWMSFFQNLGDYIVSGLVSGASGTGGNPLELLTISGIDFGTGVATLKDLGGISFKGVPMLFYCKGGLPEWLRFDPKAGVTAPEYDPQFKGGVNDLSAFADLSVYVLFGSELVKVDLSGSKLFDIYKAFVVANSSVASSRLFFVHGGTTAIDLIPVLSEGEGVWYDLQGRKLNGKPSKKGLYIMDGKKVIIK